MGLTVQVGKQIKIQSTDDKFDGNDVVEIKTKKGVVKTTVDAFIKVTKTKMPLNMKFASSAFSEVAQIFAKRASKLTPDELKEISGYQPEYKKEENAVEFKPAEMDEPRPPQKAGKVVLVEVEGKMLKVRLDCDSPDEKMGKKLTIKYLYKKGLMKFKESGKVYIITREAFLKAIDDAIVQQKGSSLGVSDESIQQQAARAVRERLHIIP